jgi:hypothetical protein
MRSSAVALLCCLFSLGCDTADDAPTGAPPTDTRGTGATIDPAQRYAAMCASCHGEAGEGGLGSRLIDSPRSVAALTQIIDERMPQGNPAACRGACASSLAAYVKTRFTSQALSCATVAPSVRRLRLLTRREYRATVRDLLALPPPGAGAPGTPPGVDPACSRHRFAYAPAATARSVHVAGSFNGWSPTAWPMTWVESAREWQTERELADGTHQYKFVVDGSQWVSDPRAAASMPDGFGGQNSVLTLRCAGTAPDAGVTPPASTADVVAEATSALPVESRPQGFAYDNNADSALATSVHVNEFLRATQGLTAAVGPRLRDVVGCDAGADRAACANTLVRGFGTRAFRRPLTAAEMQRYGALVTGARDVGQGVTRAVRAMLLSPTFLYRSEMGAAQPDGTFQLTPWEVATALSYTYWGTTPDAALLAAAADGSLATAAGTEREARRLLADPRAREQLATFALQWLGVETVATTPRSATLFPAFTDAVRASMLEEARRLVTAVAFDGTHRFDELFTTRSTWVDATLAAYYGLDGVSGSTFQRVELPAARQGGVLSLGAVLTRYAHSDQGSPILRGVFVRAALLCEEFPPPPANAGGVPDVDPNATTRDRFRQHTANAACETCHRYIDGVGFGFERFDAVGRLRETENGRPIDATGTVLDLERFGAGTRVDFTSLPQLAGTLAQSDAARACFARQYYRFARGFRETADQRCGVLDVARRFRESGYDLRELMVAVTLTRDFATRRAP